MLWFGMFIIPKISYLTAVPMDARYTTMTEDQWEYSEFWFKHLFGTLVLHTHVYMVYATSTKSMVPPQSHLFRMPCENICHFHRQHSVELSTGKNGTDPIPLSVACIIRNIYIHIYSDVSVFNFDGRPHLMDWIDYNYDAVMLMMRWLTADCSYTRVRILAAHVNTLAGTHSHRLHWLLINKVCVDITNMLNRALLRAKCALMLFQTAMGYWLVRSACPRAFPSSSGC